MAFLPFSFGVVSKDRPPVRLVDPNAENRTPPRLPSNAPRRGPLGGLEWVNMESPSDGVS